MDYKISILVLVISKTAGMFINFLVQRGRNKTDGLLNAMLYFLSDQFKKGR